MNTSKRGFWLVVSLSLLLIPALVYAWSVRPRDLAGGQNLTGGSNVAVTANGLEFTNGTAGGSDAETIQGVPITAPAIGDVGKYIEVGSGATAFIYGTPAGGGDMSASVWDGDSNGFIDLDAGGTNSTLADPGADRIMFWDDSGTVVNWLSLGTGLSITTTTMNLDAELVALAGLTSAANTIPYFTGSGTAGTITSSANMVSLLGSADYATARTNLGLAIGTNVQAYDAELAALAGLTSAANKVPYFTGSGTASVTDLSAVAINVIASGTTSAMRTNLGLAIGTDVQAYHANLAAIAGATWTGAASITTLGTIATGVWQGTAVATTYLATDIGAGNLAAALTFAEGDLIDLSGVTMSTGVDEGLALPTYADVAPATEKYYVAYDAANNALMVRESGGWVNVGASAAAPTTAHYVVTAASGNLSEESVITASSTSDGISLSDAGGDGGALTIAFASTEVTGNRTWAAGGSATIAWTYDLSGTTDPVVTFGDNYVNISTGTLQQGGQNVYYVTGTDVAVTDGGTGKSSWTQYALIYPDTTTSLSQIAVGTSGQVLRSGGAGAPGWSTATYPTTSGTSGYFLRSDGTNFVSLAPSSFSLDEIADGSTYQRIAATDVDASSHVNLLQDIDGTGAITVTGPTATRAITIDDAAQELAARNRANTFTLTNTFNGAVVAGDADTDTVTIRSLIIGGNSRAVWVASTAPTPTYATGTTEFYVEGDVEIGGTVYSSGGFTSTGTGDSYVSLANNTTYTPSSGYLLYFEGGALKVYDGTEKNLLDTASAPTLTGATWSFASVTNFVLPHGNSATADATGEIAFDDDDDRFIFQIGSTQRYFDFTGDTLNYVLKSNGSGAFTLQADETGTTPYWSTVGNPTADVTIAHDAGEETNFTFTGNYTTGSQFLIQQLTGNPSGGTLFEIRAADSDTGLAKFGDGTNAILISQAGALTLAGTASITVGGIILGDSSPDASGEIGYASNAYNLYANSEDMVWTAGTDTWTYSSNTGANLVLGNPSATNINVTSGVTVGTILYPDANDGAALGTATVSWSDLFLASGALINFNNSDVTLTHSANTLAFAGASTGYTFDSGVTVTGNINATTMSATTFTGALTGNASTATLAATSTIVDGTDATSYIVIVDSDTGSLALKTDSGVTYSATTGMLYATGFTGPLTGNASTATLAATASAVTNATLTTALTVNTGTVTLVGNAANNSSLTLPAGSFVLSGTTEYYLKGQGVGVAPIWVAAAVGGGDFLADGTVGMTGAPTPSAAGGETIGTSALPWSSLFIGASGTSTFQLTGTAAADRVVNIPDIGVTGYIPLLTSTSGAAGAVPLMTITAGKYTNSTWYLDGTSGQTYTFPTTTATLARTDAANTFTGTQSFSNDLVVTGQSSGGAKTYSILSGVTNTTQLSDVTGVSTMTAAEVSGTIITIDSSGVTRFTLPTPAVGYNTIFVSGISGVTIQVESGTSMYVNGTATATGGVGAQIVDVAPGEYITCFTAHQPTGSAAAGGGMYMWFARKFTD